MASTVENWRPVVGYEGLYEVSDLGRVRSLRRARPRILKPGRMSGGHLSVALGRGNSRTVHSLVMEAFVGPRPEGCEVRHLDGVHQHNSLGNLEYATRSRNAQDKKWHQGASTYKLRPPQITQIKERLRTGRRGIGIALAREFGVSPCVISAIKVGRLHTDVC